MIIALSILGMLIMLIATRRGIGVYPDSTVYFDAAVNLKAGNGLVVISEKRNELIPLTHYPFLYSALLASASLPGGTMEGVARWLNIILFGGNILLVGLAVRHSTPQSFWAPIGGAFLTFTAPDVLANHSVALSEPLFLVLTMGGMLLLASYFQNQRRLFLLAAAISISLACMTKYVGITGVMAGVLALLILSRKDSSGSRFGLFLWNKNLGRKLVDILVFAAITCVPIGLSVIRSRVPAGSMADREFSFHPIRFRQIVPAFSTIAQWWLLGKIRGDFRILAFVIQVLILAGLAIYLKMRGIHLFTHVAVAGERWSSQLPLLLTMFAIIYVSFLALTISIIEIDNVLDNRSLLPIHCTALVCVPWLVGSLYRQLPASRIRWVLVALSLLMAASYTIRGAKWFVQTQRDGQGYASRAWKESPLIDGIRKLPSDTPIYSNGVDAIYYLTGRRSLEIPATMIHGSAQPNPRYLEEMQEMHDDMETHHGVLVYFNTFPERWFLPAESEMRKRLPLTEISISSDGDVYRISSP
jgi:hypothetical protein